MQRIAVLGGLMAAHCEQNDLLHGGYLHDGEYCEARPPGISAESEWRAVERTCDWPRDRLPLPRLPRKLSGRWS
jgi:dihydroorotase